MEICVYGLGYVGLTSSLLLCERGHQVQGIEVVKSKRQVLSEGNLYLDEKGLRNLFQKHFNSGFFSVKETPELKEEYQACFLIAVGTPSLRSGEIDLTQVKKATLEIIERINKSPLKEVLILLRSTVSIGCNEELVLPMLREKINEDIDWSYGFYPEFLREGCAIGDFESTRSSVIALEKEDILEKFSGFFATLPGFENPKIVTFKTAEAVKLAHNSFNALRISFANELHSICGQLGVDSNELLETHSRLLDQQETRYLKPGFSYGGNCLSKDLSCLINQGSKRAIDVPLLKSISLSNETHFQRFLAIIEKSQPKIILLTGLTFKPETDDSRGSYLIKLIEELLNTPQYKDSRKVYVLEKELAYEKASFSHKEKNVLRVEEEEIDSLDFDTALLGPISSSPELLETILSKTSKVFNLGFHNYENENIYSPFKVSDEN